MDSGDLPEMRLRGESPSGEWDVIMCPACGRYTSCPAEAGEEHVNALIARHREVCEG